MVAPGLAWYELGDKVNEPFQLARVYLSADPPISQVLGQFLLQGLADTEYLESLIAKHGYGQVAEYIRGRRIPSTINTRVADFGEIVSGHLLESEERLVRPIEKLRYKFNHDWSPHLTDVFAVLINDGEITTFAYCEVKAGTTSPKNSIGADGYASLLQTWRERTPEILHFTAERLWEAQRQEEYERLDRAMARPEAISQLLRLVFVFDEAVWSNFVLEAVASAVANDSPPPGTFACYLVTGSVLRSLIDDSFDAMEELAVAP